MPLDEFAVLQIALKIGAAALVFLLGRWLARRARVTLGVTLAKTTLAPSMAHLLILSAYYGILLVSVILARFAWTLLGSCLVSFNAAMQPL